MNIQSINAKQETEIHAYWASNKRWNNKFYYKVASCWLFLLIHTTMHGSMNIKKSTGFFGEIIAVLSEHRNKNISA
jgi:hypothetical protein